MDAIETYEHAGLTIEIHVDEYSESPREWDNAGKLVIYSRYGVEVDELDRTFRTDDYSNWDELEKAVLECYPKAELLPVYRYEHSCVAYNTTGFSCPWDSCRVGFILCTYEDMLKEWGKKIVTQRVRGMARKCMASEVKTYSQWANGEVYGYIIKDENGEDLVGGFYDSCWGFYGEEYVKQEAESAAESIALKWFASAQSRTAAAEAAAAEAAGQLRLYG